MVKAWAETFGAATREMHLIQISQGASFPVFGYEKGWKDRTRVPCCATVSCISGPKSRGQEAILTPRASQATAEQLGREPIEANVNFPLLERHRGGHCGRRRGRDCARRW